LTDIIDTFDDTYLFNIVYFPLNILGRWTDELREELGYYCVEASSDGGCFWMTMDDWFYHFTTLYVCRAREASSGWSEIRGNILSPFLSLLSFWIL
jgi:hypothetical protein